MSFKSTEDESIGMAGAASLQGCVVIVPTTAADGWDAASGAVTLAHANLFGHQQVISRPVVCLLSVRGCKAA